MRSGDLLVDLLGPLAPDEGVEVDPVVAWARSGAMWLTGRADGAPLAGSNGAGAVAQALLGVVAASVSGEVRPSVAVLGERAAFLGGRRAGDRSVGGAARLLPSADGHVAVSLARPADLELVPALVEADVDGDVWATVADWCAGRTGAQVVERGRLLGLPVAAAGEPAEPGGNSAVRLVAAGERRRVERPLVVDLTSLWAGPLCAHLLALAGAEVVKVESSARPDGSRRGPRGFFDLLHGASRSVCLELGQSSGRGELRELVARADVVLTASRPRALDAMGLSPERAAAAGQVWVAITAHGMGAGADRVGFGDDIAAAGGLLAGDAAGPVFAGDALADPLAGLAAAAATLTMWRWDVTGLLDVAMVRVARVAAVATVPGGTVRASDDGWVVDRTGIAVPVHPPEARRPSGRGPELGADTAAVMGRTG